MGGQAIDRREAAKVLLGARNASPEEADEQIDWVYSIMPESRPVHRMRARRLLERGELEAAEALIARGLLTRPADPALMLLRARCLATRGELKEAEDELRMALFQRPEHCETLETASEVARRRGDHPRAIQLLEQAVEIRPEDSGIKCRLVETLLEAECLRRAETVLRSMPDRPALLEAELRRRQGRPIEAAELLERAVLVADDDARRDELKVALIELLEEMGDAGRLRKVIGELSIQEPTARSRAARALLTLGDAEEARAIAESLATRLPQRREALHVSVVAAAERGEGQAAREALHELSLTRDGIEPRRMAECWLRAFRSRIVRRQRSARQAGADPSLRMLHSLVREAEGTLSRVLRKEEAELSGGERAELERHRATCLAVMGELRLAAGAFARSRSEAGSEARPEPAAPRRKAA